MRPIGSTVRLVLIVVSAPALLLNGSGLSPPGEIPQVNSPADNIKTVQARTGILARVKDGLLDEFRRGLKKVLQTGRAKPTTTRSTRNRTSESPGKMIKAGVNAACSVRNFILHTTTLQVVVRDNPTQIITSGRRHCDDATTHADNFGASVNFLASSLQGPVVKRDDRTIPSGATVVPGAESTQDTMSAKCVDCEYVDVEATFWAIVRGNQLDATPTSAAAETPSVQVPVLAG